VAPGLGKRLASARQERRDRTPPIVTPIGLAMGVGVVTGAMLDQPVVILVSTIVGTAATFAVLIRSERERKRNGRG
jgi:hypothetical protein